MSQNSVCLLLSMDFAQVRELVHGLEHETREDAGAKCQELGGAEHPIFLAIANTSPIRNQLQ